MSGPSKKAEMQTMTSSAKPKQSAPPAGEPAERLRQKATNVRGRDLDQGRVSFGVKLGFLVLKSALVLKRASYW